MIILVLLVIGILFIPAQIIESKPGNVPKGNEDKEKIDFNGTYNGTWVSFNFNNSTGEITNLTFNGTTLWTPLFYNITPENFTLQKLEVGKNGFEAKGIETKLEISDDKEAKIELKALQDLKVSISFPKNVVILPIEDRTLFIDWTDINGTLEIGKGSTMSVDDCTINSSIPPGKNLEFKLYSAYPSDNGNGKKNDTKDDKKDKDTKNNTGKKTSNLTSGNFLRYYLAFKYNLFAEKLENISIHNVTVFNQMIIENGSFNQQKVSPHLFKGDGPGTKLLAHDNPIALIQVLARTNITVYLNPTKNWALNQTDRNVTLSRNNMSVVIRLVGKPASYFLNITNTSIPVVLRKSSQLKIYLLNTTTDENKVNDDEAQKQDKPNDDKQNNDKQYDNDNKKESKPKANPDKNTKSFNTGNFSGKYLAFQYNLSAERLNNVSVYNSTIFNHIIMVNSSYNQQHVSPHLFKGEGSGARLLAHDNPIALIQVLARENITVILNITENWILNQLESNVTLTNNSLNITVRLVGKPGSHFLNVTDSTITLLLRKSNQLQIRLINLTSEDKKATLPGNLWFEETEDMIFDSIGYGYLGGDITITGPYGAPEINMNTFLEDFTLDVEKVENKEVSFILSSYDPSGKYVMLAVLKETLNLLGDSEVKILLDNDTVLELKSLSLTPPYKAGYYRVFDEKGEQILISVPNFSEHEITVQFIPEVRPDKEDLLKVWSYWDYISIIGILIVILIAGVHLYIVRRKD